MDLYNSIPEASGIYQIAKHIIIGAVALFIAAACTGCATLAGEGWAAGDSGRILISADERGMQSFGDALTGLVVTGKATPDADDTHYKTRRQQDNTRRYLGWSARRPEHTQKEKAALQRTLQEAK